NMWRAVGASREDDLSVGPQSQLFAVPTCEDTTRAPAVELDTLHQRVCYDVQIGALQGGPQVAARGTPAFSVMLCHLIATYAELARCVKIIISGIAAFHCGMEHAVNQGVHRAAIANVERAIRSMEIATFGFICF